MTKRPPLLIAAVVLTYIFLVVFVIAMIAGASYTALSVFILLTEGIEKARPFFFAGIGLILFGYLVNVFMTFLLTKKWNWKLTTGFEFKPTSKKK